MPILIFLISLFILACGLALLLSADRRNKRLVCRRCGYDLAGSLDSARCPECGGELTGAGIRLPGERILYRWRFLLGLILAIGGTIASFITMMVLMAFMLKQ